MNDWKNLFPKENRYYETKNGILYCGDCLDIIKQIPENSIDLLVTDPPYRITSKGCSGNSGGMLKKDINKKGKVFDFNDIEVKNWMPKVFSLLKKRTHYYIMVNHKNLYEFLKIIYNLNDIYFIKSLIWNKKNKIMGRFYMSTFEYILFGRKGEAKKINNCGMSDIITIPNKKTKINNENIHDTEKPIKLMEILIKNSSNENDLILDPFLGSGTTAIACEKLNRKWIGIEIDKKYCEISKQRIKEISNLSLQQDLFR